MESPEKRIRRLTITKPTVHPGDVPVGFILGIGNPLLDIVAYVEKPFLEKYNLKLNNAILAEDHHIPMYKELKENHKVEYIAGGATQNSIRVAQWMLQSPGSTAFIGSVGKNCEFGKKLKEVAENDGVETIYYEADGHSTGTCAVVVHEKERSLIANLAAANAFDYAHIESPRVKEAINRSRIVYSAGFFLTLPHGPKSVLEIAKHCSEFHKIYCLNFAAPFICNFFHDPLMQVMPFADYVFGNESEATEFGKKMGCDTTDLTEVAAKVAALPKQTSVHEGVLKRILRSTQYGIG